MSSFQQQQQNEADEKASKNNTLQRDKANNRNRLRYDANVGTFGHEIWNNHIINMLKTLIGKEYNIQE